MHVRASLVALSLAALVAAACDKTESPPGGAGGNGGSGGCPSGPQPLFELHITAKDAAVPADTTVAVTWSAAQEPLFVLADSTTWKTLDDGVNVVCDVDRMGPPPTDLQELVCHLWTSSATEVAVSAWGWVTYHETLQPEQSEQCDGPVPKRVLVELTREVDGGMQ